MDEENSEGILLPWPLWSGPLHERGTDGGSDLRRTRNVAGAGLSFRPRLGWLFMAANKQCRTSLGIPAQRVDNLIMQHVPLPQCNAYKLSARGLKF